MIGHFSNATTLTSHIFSYIGALPTVQYFFLIFISFHIFLIFCIFFHLTLSTLTTLAPKSDNIIPQKGTGANPANSTTRIPLSAIWK